MSPIYILTAQDRQLLRSFDSLSLHEMAVKFPDAWKDFMEMHRTCLTAKDKFSIKLEIQWFLYAMGYHQGRIEMGKFLAQQKDALSTRGRI